VIPQIGVPGEVTCHFPRTFGHCKSNGCGQIANRKSGSTRTDPSP
jgi:hypothetical protein